MANRCVKTYRIAAHSLAVMSQQLVDTVDGLLEIVAQGEFRRIGVDGINGSGKTTLARQIGENAGIAVIELDEHLEKNLGGFVKHIRFGDVTAAIEGGDFVIEGVCLMEVIELLQGDLDLMTYVQRFCRGMWSDEDVCDIPGDVEDVIERERGHLRALAQYEATTSNKPETTTQAELPEVTEEVIRYHAKYRPHKRAQILYQRKDC